ncbi:TPA: hypothetical protein NJY08_004874 [Salmonella enterica subsp. enterica serovar Typhi str. AG3]|nr:hypothetical protein [Salmonella enterica subsp. enterica serovar Typhi str. AG3]
MSTPENDKPILNEYNVNILSAPQQLNDGSILFQKVQHTNGTETLLWFPPNQKRNALKIKPQTSCVVIGWYDPKWNCINVPTSYNAMTEVK